MVKSDKVEFKVNELLDAYRVEFEVHNDKKVFWQVVAGITGQNYTSMEEIPEGEQEEILTFLQKQEKEGNL